MNSESVDLTYLDPPFNSNRNYSAPVGSAAEGDGGIVTGADIDGQDGKDILSCLPPSAVCTGTGSNTNSLYL